MLECNSIETGFADHEDYQIDFILTESDSALNQDKSYL